MVAVFVCVAIAIVHARFCCCFSCMLCSLHLHIMHTFCLWFGLLSCNR